MTKKIMCRRELINATRSEKEQLDRTRHPKAEDTPVPRPTAQQIEMAQIRNQMDAGKMPAEMTEREEMEDLIFNDDEPNDMELGLSFSPYEIPEIPEQDGGEVTAEQTAEQEQKEAGDLATEEADQELQQKIEAAVAAAKVNDDKE
jgi:hypothetical protein